MAIMQASLKIITFIASQEGYRPVAYRPLPTDRWTVGFGSTYIDGVPVKEGDTLDTTKAYNILAKGVQIIADQLNKIAPKNIDQYEFDAVVSLVYNIGINQFIQNDIGKKFRNGENISDKFLLYNRSGGKVVLGLVKRRQREKEIYDNGNYKGPTG